MTKPEPSRPAGDAQPGVTHDTPPPPKFVEFMLKNWAPAERAPVAPYPHAARTQERRESLSRHFSGEVLVVPSGNLKVRSNDEYYPFRACSDFVYLTGHQEPDSVLVMVPQGGGHRAVLFVDPNPGKTDASFFTDRIKGELWEGPRLGVPESAARYGIEDARPLGGLRTFVQEVVREAPKARVLRGHAAGLEVWIERDNEEQRELDREFGVALSEMRLVKDEGEIGELRNAIDLTKKGFEDIIRSLRMARSERELESAFFARARLEGNGTGYQPVVAAGPHACTLHWRKNNGPVRAGELLLVDAGVENQALYTADITRVLPINGAFGREQREVYELVLSAQRAAMGAVKPGNDFMEPNRTAMKVLAQGLEAMGILTVPAEEALKDENQFYRRYSLHNISHMLGLDVHDCAKARAEVYKYGPLVAGHVLTIEPGLYFQPDDQTVPERYRGIGVRIEDNVLVTPDGHVNLSAHIPTAPDDVERWMANIWGAAR
ncbi:MAG: aminopeptidase P family protein [Polyangiaceae bacterium]|jgi:Xaa-Pro aminopeptidase|nr:aminopeptidase P family protein [Polyangiaceae bacterium]